MHSQDRPLSEKESPRILRLEKDPFAEDTVIIDNANHRENGKGRGGKILEDKGGKDAFDPYKLSVAERVKYFQEIAGKKRNDVALANYTTQDRNAGYGIEKGLDLHISESATKQHFSPVILPNLSIQKVKIPAVQKYSYHPPFSNLNVLQNNVCEGSLASEKDILSSSFSPSYPISSPAPPSPPKIVIEKKPSNGTAEEDADCIEYDVNDFDRKAHDLEGLSDVSDDGYRDDDKCAEKTVSKNKQNTHESSVYLQQIAQKRIKKSNAIEGRKTCPLKGNDNRRRNSNPISIFVGTWNCEYQEFSSDVVVNTRKKDVNIGVDSSCNEINESIENTEVVVGSYEGGKNNSLKVISEGSKEVEMEQDLGEEEAGPNGEGRIGFIRQSTKMLKKLNKNEQPLRDWILPNYDIYVVSIQESMSDNIFYNITKYLSVECDVSYERIEFEETRISGYGDGALLSMKSTSIACWVRSDKLYPIGPVKAGSSKATSLSFFNGSKGAVSLVLSIYNQYICFIGCHMPATGRDDRLKAREIILSRLSESYCGIPNVHFSDIFHHLIWTGDFNFRLQNCTARNALELITAGKLNKLLIYDEFLHYTEDLKKLNFTEAPISFIPTYKKKDRRLPPKKDDKDWAEKEYHTKYNVKWYKGGHQEERPPSWTDRVIKWSLGELESCLTFIPDTYFAASPSVQTLLIASDHNPVGCGLHCFPLNSKYALPPIMLTGKSKNT